MADYDFSTAAQYAALGRAMKTPRPAAPAPKSIPGLAALGRYVGASSCHPPSACAEAHQEMPARRAA